MSIELDYEFLVGLLMVVLVLALAARRLHLPSAVALIVGGIALAFIPGIPVVAMDPDLVMVVFLPPLLLSSAYQTVWLDFKQYFAAISSLAVGAVAFTTLSVGAVVHWLRPDIPWSAAFALGAIVSPPDAVAARAVLDKLRLPTRVTTVLTGESLVNDASGLVLFHFAVSAALNGSFDAPVGVATFFVVSLGGVMVGLSLGWVALRLLRQFANSELVVTGTLLLAAVSYMISDRLGFSGVLATVTTGLMLGWQQHEIFSAATRIRAQAFWRVLVFLLESLLFVLIGLSLRQALNHFESVGDGLQTLALPVAAVVVTVIVARFVWLVGSDMIWTALSRVGIHPKHLPSIPTTVILSWAGMRGAVTLAAALSLPINFPGRDLILASAFGVILVTVLVQGTTLPLVIRLFPSITLKSNSQLARDEAAVRKKVADIQYQAMLAHCRSNPSHGLPHMSDRDLFSVLSVPHFNLVPERRRPLSDEHFEAILCAIRTGREEVLKMYRTGHVSDRIMRNIEQDLDLQELATLRRRDEGAL
ncbi:Na+/H+ antiporter [Neorhizobium alkalisoli]|uniref:Sodium/proton antiporter (CPA1 family) n=1 Tax=Neorhizobium alkalisoli TaxID=528178 RepID=A0A561R8D5_9HYPH|nr:Na+/H+ antiporter [Neorhizobium alkalisoli]TWF58864.1 sodium/proton antiporter (CPA1 family) [Neorhizobium alkalisoli]